MTDLPNCEPRPEDFARLLGRVRAGDEAAATELFRQYEQQIRRVIRVRMTDPTLRRQMDSVDICQSVMGQFYVRASLGEFELSEPKQLIGLLATMARNALLTKVEAHRAGKRDGRRIDLEHDPEWLMAGSGTPSAIVCNRELLAEVRGRMSNEEQQVAERRAAGDGWDAIARDLKIKPDALRKRYTRALERISTELGLDFG